MSEPQQTTPAAGPSTAPSAASPVPVSSSAAPPAAPPSRQEIERRLSISLPSAPKPVLPPLEPPRAPARVIREVMSESDEADDGEDEDEDEEEDGFGVDEDDEMRRKLDEERVIRSGYLDKKGEKRKTWKKRWFVLRTGKLSFYKDSKEYKLLRIIDLSDVHSAAPVQHAKYASAFGIVTTRRTFYLKAADKAEAEGWVADVNAARRSP